MTDVVKAQRVALPQARSIRWNPSPEELRELTSTDAQRAPHRVRQLQRADQGGVPEQGQHLHHHRPPRGAHRPDALPRGRAQHRRAPGRAHPRPRHGGRRRLHRQRPGAPRARAPLHRGGLRQHRGHAALAVLRQRGPGRRGLGPTAHRHLHAVAGGPRLPGEPGDRRRPRRGRDPRAQQRLLRRVRRRAACACGTSSPTTRVGWRCTPAAR